MHWIVIWTITVFAIAPVNDYGDLGMIMSFHSGVKREEKLEHQMFSSKEDATDFIKRSDAEIRKTMHLFELQERRVIDNATL